MGRVIFFISLLVFLGGFGALDVHPAFGVGLFVLGLGGILYSLRAGFFMLMTNLSYHKGGLKTSLKWMKLAYKTKSLNQETIVTYSFLLLKNAEMEEAEKVLLELSARQSRSGAKKQLYLTQSMIALLRWKQGQKQEAIEILQTLLNRGYETKTLYANLGYFLLETSTPAKAFQVNQKAHDFDSQDPAILDNLGYNFFLMKHLEKAQEIYSKLMHKEPSFPEAYFHQALVYEAQGKILEAKEACSKALEMDFHFLTTIGEEKIQEKMRKLEEGK